MAVGSLATVGRHEISRYQWAVLAASGLDGRWCGFDFTLFTQVAGPATSALTGHAAPFYSGLVVPVSALAVTSSIGRVLTAAGPMVAGIIATQWFGGSIPLATTAVAGLLVLSFIGSAFIPESHGRFVFVPGRSQHMAAAEGAASGRGT